MFYLEGYGTAMLWQDDYGNAVVRKVENVFLPDWEGFDRSIRPVVDSSPGNIHRRAWEFDSYYHTKPEFDRLMANVLE